MTVYTQNVNVGSSFEQTFVYTLNDTPVNLTGWGAVFRLRDASDNVISTVRYGDTGDRSLTIDASHGTIDVTMVASATSGFPSGVGTFELEIYELINTGRVFRIVDGAVRYRPRGRAMLDNTVCVIRSTTNAVTVETQNISQYQRIDRGPPGAAGASALNETTPAISEDPAVGSSGRALRLDAQYGKALASRDGFMRKEDKGWTDAHQLNVVFSPPPSGDTTGATDPGLWDTKIALAKATGRTFSPLPGAYYFNREVDMSGLIGVNWRASVGRGDASTGLVITYRGSRVAGKAIIALATESDFIDFKGLALRVHASSENPVYGIRIGNGAADITSTKFSHLTLSGRFYTPGTSTTVITLSVAAHTVTTDGATNFTPYIGTPVVLREQASPFRRIRGVIDSYNTSTHALQFTTSLTRDIRVAAGEVIGVATNTNDWNIYLPIDQGVTCSSTHAISFAYTSIGGCYNGMYIGGNGVTVERTCVFPSSNCTGFHVVVSGGSAAYVGGVYSPNSDGSIGIGEFVYAENVDGIQIQISSGDQPSDGQMVEIDHCRGVVVAGCYLNATKAGIGAFRFNTVNGFFVAGNNVQMGTGGAVIDYRPGGNVGSHLPNYRDPSTLEYLGTAGADVTTPFLFDGSTNFYTIWNTFGAESRYSVYYAGPGGTGYGLRNNAILLGSNRTGEVRVNPTTTSGALLEQSSAAQHPLLGAGWTLLTGDLSDDTKGVAFGGRDDAATALDGSTSTKLGVYATLGKNGLQLNRFGTAVVSGFLTATAGGDWSFGSKKLTSVADPSSAQDAVTKNYYDTHIPPLIQSGVVTLVAGTTSAISATITANSRIIVSQKTPNTTASTVEYAALSADRVVGSPGSFKVTALLAAGTINTADISTVDYLIIG